MGGYGWDIATATVPSQEHPLTGINFLRAFSGNRAASKQRSYERAARQFAVERASRAHESYLDESQREEQRLIQSLWGRGVGQSSIATEDLAYFHRAKERSIQNLNNEIDLARRAQSAYRSRSAHMRNMGPANFIDRILESVGQVAKGFMSAGVGMG